MRSSPACSRKKTCTPAGFGTRHHVLFLIRALYSSSIALCQCGSLRAERYDLGIGDIVVVAERFSFVMGLRIPERARVCIGCVGRGDCAERISGDA
jgi:hypothetical protein